MSDQQWTVPKFYYVDELGLVLALDTSLWNPIVPGHQRIGEFKYLVVLLARLQRSV